MKAHTIVVVEHFWKDGVDIDTDPDTVESDFRVSYANEVQYAVAIAAVHAYIAALGLPRLQDVPPYDMTDYGEGQSEFSCSEGKNITVAVYTFIG